jgi:hypothetical protein
MSDDDFDLEEDCSEYSDDLDDYHNQGEQDGANDNWSPPHSFFAIEIETRMKLITKRCAQLSIREDQLT